MHPGDQSSIAPRPAPPPGRRLQSKAGWYYHRLRSMSPLEVAHRAAEQIKRAAWRGYSRGWEAFDIGDGALPALPGLAQALAAAPAGLRQRIGAAAQGIRERPLETFGQRWGGMPLPQALAADPMMFHLDPVSRRHWPAETYCFNIPYREPEGFGDYKFCAELNTMQVCQPLAAAARLDPGGADVRLVWQIWNAWYEANPPFRGINWVSGVNIALRVVSLLVTASLLEDASAETRRRMRALLNASGFWLARYPSLHSSANNHLLAESVGLFALGTLCPDLPGSARYARIGRTRIERHMLRLIGPDGAGAEMSPSYAAFACEWGLLAAAIAGSAGQPLSSDVSDRLGAAAQWFKWMMDDAGHVPSIGDNDNSCVIATGMPESRYVASITAAIAAMTGKPELAPVTADAALRDALFGIAKPGAAQSDGIRHFDQGGMSIVRETRGAVQTVLVFDHGPLGHLQIAAHGHADTLAIWLSVGDQPVLVDAGTYLYGGSRWRAHFRGTAAHNTVELAGRSSSSMSGPFNWSQKARGRLLSADDRGWSMAAEHDGYVASLGCTHVRRLARTTTGFRIEDHLDGGSASARIGFLMHPDLSTEANGNAVHVMRDGARIMSLVSSSDWRPQVIRGLEGPMAGWYSSSFGIKTAADQIVFAGEMGKQPIVTDIIVDPALR